MVQFLQPAGIVYFTDRPKLPFLAKLALDFNISGLENAINLKFWPVLGIDNTSLLWKFQRNRINGYAESEYFE